MLVAKIVENSNPNRARFCDFLVVLYRVDYVNNPLTNDCIYRKIEFDSKKSAEGWVKDKGYPLVEERHTIYS